MVTRSSGAPCKLSRMAHMLCPSADMRARVIPDMPPPGDPKVYHHTRSPSVSKMNAVLVSLPRAKAVTKKPFGTAPASLTVKLESGLKPGAAPVVTVWSSLP